MAVYSTAGTLLQVNNGTAFINVSHCESIEGPSGSKQEIDTTALDDTATTSVPGTPDYGDITVSLFDDGADAGIAFVKTAYDTGVNAIKPWKIIKPFSGTNNTAAFNGYVKSWGLSLGKNSPGKINFTIKVSGTVTVT